MRNNEKRFGQPSRPEDTSSPAAQASQLSYVVPTEFVELPSKGRFYSEDHPLHNQETIEIKFMTAKEEDILSSETLIKKGLVLDRLFKNLIVDQNIDPTSLLVGDRNAIMIAARISGYGAGYTVKMSCPLCQAPVEHTFDLRSSKINEQCFDQKFLEESKASFNQETQNFKLELPVSGVEVELRLLTGKEEVNLEDSGDSIITSTLKAFIVSVNGEENQDVVGQFAENIPAADSRHIRKVYSRLIPNIDTTQEFVCKACSYSEDMEVPLSAEFFWPGQ
jgi:rubrerythrin